MEKKKLTIDDLLKALKTPSKESKQKLANTRGTWERIGKRDTFDELGLEKSELTNFLAEWIQDNPYANI